MHRRRKRSGRRFERPERSCDKRSLSCPLSERRRRHPRLFAVLDLLILWGQAKSTKENSRDFQSAQRLGSSFRSHLSPHKFFLLFLLKKEQRRPRGENDRETNSGSLKRAPVAGLRHIRAVSTVAARQSPRAASALACGPSLQANRPRFFTLATVRFFFRHFHIAGACRPTACHRNTMQCPISASDSVPFCRSSACMIALRKARKKRRQHWNSDCRQPVLPSRKRDVPRWDTPLFQQAL